MWYDITPKIKLRRLHCIVNSCKKRGDKIGRDNITFFRNYSDDEKIKLAEHFQLIISENEIDDIICRKHFRTLTARIKRALDTNNNSNLLNEEEQNVNKR